MKLAEIVLGIFEQGKFKINLEPSSGSIIPVHTHEGEIDDSGNGRAFEEIPDGHTHIITEFIVQPTDVDGHTHANISPKVVNNTISKNNKEI